MNKTAAFLLGSGVSLKSKAKDVTKIGRMLLDRSWKENRHALYCLSRQPNSSGTPARAQAFLRRLRDFARRAGTDPNYEDLYACTLQLYQHRMGERQNVLLAQSLDEIEASVADLVDGIEPASGHDPFTALLLYAIKLIQSAVHSALASQLSPVGFDGLGWVARQVNRLDIFTLNHDVLTEIYLDQADITFTDGFNVHRPRFRRWNPDWDNSTYHTRLLKLHGSVNWYLGEFRNEKGEALRQYIAVDSTLRLRSLHSQIPSLVELEPHFLTGTLVKEQHYHTDLIGDLFIKFRELLSQHRRLICCGYGWGDHGINERIAQWLRDCGENRLIILHGNARTREADIDHKPFWRRYRTWLNSDRVEIIPCWLPELQSTPPEDLFTET